MLQAAERHRRRTRLLICSGDNPHRFVGSVTSILTFCISPNAFHSFFSPFLRSTQATKKNLSGKVTHYVWKVSPAVTRHRTNRTRCSIHSCVQNSPSGDSSRVCIFAISNIMDVVVAGAETADLQSQLFQRRSHTDNSTNQRRYTANLVLFEIFDRVQMLFY